jgi:hypothetical protein
MIILFYSSMDSFTSSFIIFLYLFVWIDSFRIAIDMYIYIYIYICIGSNNSNCYYSHQDVFYYVSSRIAWRVAVVEHGIFYENMSWDDDLCMNECRRLHNNSCMPHRISIERSDDRCYRSIEKQGIEKWSSIIRVLSPNSMKGQVIWLIIILFLAIQIFSL